MKKSFEEEHVIKLRKHPSFPSFDVHNDFIPEPIRRLALERYFHRAARHHNPLIVATANYISTYIYDFLSVFLRLFNHQSPSSSSSSITTKSSKCELTHRHNNMVSASNLSQVETANSPFSP